MTNEYPTPADLFSLEGKVAVITEIGRAHV